MSEADNSTSMSTSATRANKKIVVPKVWKRPHSTIYGKNVEFGSKLYSDKLGELDSRKFNPELASSWRSNTSSSYSAGQSTTSNGPYGSSLDGRKLSLGSINPQSYRPSVPVQKAAQAQASDGEQFEFQDKSSPFYTDRWAGRTIRHFDADLYSNAHLFKTMIL